MFRCVCDNDGKLLFKIDPMCGIIEIQRRGVRTYVDLTEFGMHPVQEAVMGKVAFEARITEIESGENPRGGKRSATEITVKGGIPEEIEKAINDMMVSGGVVTVTMKQPDNTE